MHVGTFFFLIVYVVLWVHVLFSVYFLFAFTACWDLTILRFIPQFIDLWHRFHQDKDDQQTRSSVKFCQVAVAFGSIAPIAMSVFVILGPKDPLTCLQVMVNLSKLSCWKGQKQHHSTCTFDYVFVCLEVCFTMWDSNVKKGPLYWRIHWGLYFWHTQVEPWSLNSPSKSRLVRNSQFRMNWKNNDNDNNIKI